MTRPAIGTPRTSPARRSARWEQWNGPAWRTQVDWVQTELANLRVAFQWSVGRGHIEVATDIAAHAALMGFSVELFETIGWAESLLDAATRADVRRLPRLYAAAGYACFVGRAALRDRARPPGDRAGAPAGYESCEPGYATFIEALGQVYCGNLDRYIELTRGRRCAAGRRPGVRRSRRTSTACSRPAGSTRRWSSPTPALAAAREVGNPYWLVYTLWIVGLAYSKADPPRALEIWDEGVEMLAEHDVRFFEGFLARDAALLHTSDGQLDMALTLFDTSIAAFLRSGAVAQLVITLASLPALFERLDRPGVARTLLGAMAKEQASFHHVPTLAELGERLDARLGDEAAARFASVGGAMDLHDAAAYAVHEIELSRRALAGPSQHGGEAFSLTPRETQVLRLIADGATTREISDQLFISAKTADNHIQHIYTKLGVTNRAAATRWALDREVVVRASETDAG